MIKHVDPNRREIEERRDAALRRALNTPPRQHKDMKKGKKKRQDVQPTAAAENERKRT